MIIEIIWLNILYLIWEESFANKTGSPEEIPDDFLKPLLHYLKTCVIRGSSFAVDMDRVDFFLEPEPKVSTKNIWLTPPFHSLGRPMKTASLVTGFAARIGTHQKEKWRGAHRPKDIFLTQKRIGALKSRLIFLALKRFLKSTY